ncbi:MAG: cell division protein FtsW [Alphaproteobacteria bacterium]|nr:cell division protein FtsW [Alphaproteobacteria bacterium]
MFSREKKTLLAEWWWTVDREMLGALMLLLTAGIVMSFAASPAVAERLGKDDWYFIVRHIGYTVPTLMVLVGASLMTPRQARIGGLVLLLGSIFLLGLTVLVGTEVNGSQRWLSFGGLSIQPSEFVKPGFAIIAAWLISEKFKRQNVPSHTITLVLLAIISGLLILQPDIGQTALVVMTWAGLLFIAGISWWVIIALVGLSGAGFVAAYVFFPHVARRIDSFINPGVGDNYQIDKALQSLSEGGWFGRGPGEAVAARALPDAHADFVFSAAAGEFGILFSLALVVVIVFVVTRGLWRAQALPNMFSRLAASALALQFGLQAVINLAVNLNLVPPKGMTLPFVSYGGTSMIAIAFGMGVVLALTRRNPREAIASGLPLNRVAAQQPAQ